jgi:hypothetical protein
VVAAKIVKWVGENVTATKLVCWWRENIALLFDLLDVYVYDGVLFISEIN